MTGMAEALIGDIEFRINQGGAAYLMRQQAEMGRMWSARSKRAGGAFSPSACNLWRVAHGSNSAVLKKIHNGGTHTSAQLTNQLNYLFSKASSLFANMVEHDPRARTLSPDERKAIVEQWSDEWTGDPKNGHTTHLLISFPWDVAANRATPIVEQWAAEMFQSGRYVEDEEWAYVAALHSDRANAHVHIVVNNRGIENDTWFYMAKGHAFDLDVMKERLVEIAEDHGMYLDSSSRIDRGILTYGPTRAEIEAAAREDRAPVEKMRTGRALTDALEHIRSNVRMMRQLASLATLIDEQDIAQRFVDAADLLEGGGIVHPRNMEILMDAQAIKTRGDLADAYEKWMDETEKDLSRLPLSEQKEMRDEFYQIASEISRDLGDNRGAQLMHHKPRTVLYQTRLAEGQVASLGAERDLSDDGAQEITDRIGKLATEVGLDAREIRQRMTIGAATAWQEREWVKKDVLDVAEVRKIDLNTEEGRGRVAQIVDGFYDAAARVISQAVQVDHGSSNDKLNRALDAMAASYERDHKVEFQQDGHAKRFSDDFRARYGEDAIERIAEGDTRALSVDYPDENRRRAIARAIVAAADRHQQIGLTLEQVRKASLKLDEQERIAHHRDRDKDHGYEL